MPEPKRTYESAVIALPPLKMVLCDERQRESERKPRPAPPQELPAPLDRQEIVLRIIAHLKED